MGWQWPVGFLRSTQKQFCDLIFEIVQRLKKRRVSDCHEFDLTLTKFPGQAENFFSSKSPINFFFGWIHYCIASHVLCPFGGLSLYKSVIPKVDKRSRSIVLYLPLCICRKDIEVLQSWLWVRAIFTKQPTAELSLSQCLPRLSLYQGAWKDLGFRCCSAPRAGKYLESFGRHDGSVPDHIARDTLGYRWISCPAVPDDINPIGRSRRFTKVLLWHSRHTCEGKLFDNNCSRYL